MNRIASAFRSLKYRNFRLFFPGLVTSQVGIWIQNVAISWVVYEITNSPFMMGLIMFFNTIPLFLVTPFAGVIIDKFNRHKLLMMIQVLFALQSFLIAVFALSGHLRIWNIVLLGVFLNIIAAIDTPLRQSTYIRLVDDKRDLSNAISLNSTCFNVARLIGPALAGVLLSLVGAGGCFLINFFCIFPSVILVAMMRFEDKKSDKIKNETILEGLKEGWEYAFSSEQILTLLAFIGLFAFIALSYPMLMPIYTKDVLHGDSRVLGYVMSSAGIGALCSSIFLAAKTTLRGLKYILCVGAFLLSAAFICLGFTNNLVPACVFMFCVGFGMTSAMTPENTLLQSIVDDDKRGRIMSIHTICFTGVTSLSSFVIGSVTQVIGVSRSMILFGSVLFAAGIFFTVKFCRMQFESKLF